MRVANPIQPTSNQFDLMYWTLAQRFKEAAHTAKRVRPRNRQRSAMCETRVEMSLVSEMSLYASGVSTPHCHLQALCF